jgi:hypothetical protein
VQSARLQRREPGQAPNDPEAYRGDGPMTDAAIAEEFGEKVENRTE